MPSFYDRTPLQQPSFYDRPSVLPADVPHYDGAGELERGVRRGLSTIANTGQAALGAGIQPFAPEMGRNIIAGAIEDMGASTQRNPAAVPTWDDVHGLGDTLLYGTGKFGEMAPLMPLGLGGAAAGRVAGGLAASELGAAAAFAPINIGDQAMQLQQDPAARGLSPVQKTLHAAGVGGVQSLLEGAVPAGAINRYVKGAPSRSVGSALRTAAGDFTKGTAAMSAEEGLQEVVGQAGRFSYDPNAELDPAAIKETMIGAAFGGAPMAAAHAGAAQVADAAAGGIRLGKKAAETAGAGAKFVGKEAYNALPDQARAALDKAAELAASPAEAYKAAAAAVGGTVDDFNEYVASVKERQPDTGDAVTDAASRTVQVAHDIAGVFDGAGAKAEVLAERAVGSTVRAGKRTLSKALYSDEERLSHSVDRLGEKYTGQGVDEFGDMTERADLFEGIHAALNANPHTATETRALARIQEAADALRAFAESDAPPDAVALNEAIAAGSSEIRLLLNADKTKARLKTLAAELKADGTRFSRMTSPEKIDLNASQNHVVDDNVVMRAIDRAFKVEGLSTPDRTAWRNEVTRVIRESTRHLAHGEASRGFKAEFSAYLRDVFGEGSGGRLDAALFDAADLARQAREDMRSADKDTRTQGVKNKALTSKRTDLFEFIKSSLRKQADGKPDARVSEVLNLVRKHTELLDEIAKWKITKAENLPQGLRDLLEERIAARDEMGIKTETADLRELASDEATQNLKNELRGLLKGDPDHVIQRVLDMHEEQHGAVRRELATNSSYNENAMNAAEVAYQEDGLGEGKDDGENYARLSEAPNIAERDVQDQSGRPVTGHPSQRHGQYGEIGFLQVREAKNSAPHSTSGQRGKRPARSDGSGHVEVSRVNALEHVMSLGEEELQNEKLAEWHANVKKEAGAEAVRIEEELRAAGIDPTEALAELEAAFGKDEIVRRIAKENKAPWEVFDARKIMATKHGYSEKAAQQINDLFWANVHADYRGTPREFFEKFPHHFITTRNNAGSHERLDSVDLNKGLVTATKAKKQGIESISPKDGYIEIIDADGNIAFLDVPKLIEHSIGKTRTRNEGLAEDGTPEYYEAGLLLPNGEVNQRYVSDLLTAFANVSISLADSKTHTMTAAAAEAMMHPADELLLVRGARDKRGKRVGDVSFEDVSEAGKKRVKLLDADLTPEEQEKQLAKIILMNPPVQNKDALAKGIISGVEGKPIIFGGAEVSIDLQQLIARTAAQLGVDMTDAPRRLYYAMLNEGIHALHILGVNREALQMPTRGIPANVTIPAKDGKPERIERVMTYVLNRQYKHAVLGDKPYRLADEPSLTRDGKPMQGVLGKLVSNAEDTQVVLRELGPRQLRDLHEASRLDADRDARSIASMAGFLGLLKNLISKRDAIVDTPPPLVTRLLQLNKEALAAAKAYAEAIARGETGEKEKGPHTVLNADLSRLKAEAKRLNLDIDRFAKSSGQEINRLRTAEKEEHERDGKKKARDDLDDKANGELIAKYENVLDLMYEKMGGFEDRIDPPSDGTTGRLTQTLQNVQRAEQGTTDFEDVTTKSGEKVGAIVTVPEMKEDVERASRGNMVPGDTGVKRRVIAPDKERAPEETAALKKAADDEYRAAVAEERSKIDKALGRGKPREKAAEVAPPDAVKRDSKLQTFLDDIKSGARPDVNAEPHMYKAWHDEAAKLPESKARDWAMKQLETFAEMDGVDIKTGQFKAGAQEVTRPVLYNAKNIENGAAEVRFGPTGGLQLLQGGGLVGKLMDSAVSEAMRAGNPVTATIARKGTGYAATVSYAEVAKEMKPYNGADSMPVKGADRIFGTKKMSFAKTESMKIVAQEAEVAAKAAIKEGRPVLEAIKKVEATGKPKYSRIVLPGGKEIDAADVEAVQKHADMMLGNPGAARAALGRMFDSEGKDVGGEFTTTGKGAKDFFFTVAQGMKSVMGSNIMHETMHGLFHVLGTTESGKAALDKITRSLTGPVMRERVRRALDKLELAPEARAEIDKAMNESPEEAAAYAFQLWATKSLTLGDAPTGIFGKMAQWIRNLIGITREHERTEAFLNKFMTGELAKADFKPSALETAFAEQRGDRAIQQIKEAMEPFMKVVHEVFDSSVRAMERIEHADAAALLRKYTGHGENEGYIHRVSIESRILAGKIQNLMSPHGQKGFSDALRSVYEGNIDTPAAKQIKEFIERVNVYAGRPKDHMPTIWDFDKIANNRKAFDAAVADFGVKSAKKGGAAEVINLLDDMGYDPAVEDRIDFLPQYDSEKAKWMQADPTKFMRSFIVQSVKRTEHQKIFPQGQGEIDAALKRIQATAGQEAFVTAKKFVEGMEGRLGQGMNKDVRSMMNAIMTAGNVITLPFSVFSAMVDPFHLASRSSSLGDAGAAYAKGVGSIFKTLKTLVGKEHENTAEEQFAEDIGAIEHAMMTDVLGDIYLGDHAQGWTKKVNDWFFKANFLDGWTRQMRVAAVTAGQRFIIEHAKGEGVHSKHYMEELGLKPSDVVSEDGSLVINDKIKMALNKFVDESIVRPDAATNAIWMNDPRFALLSHMKRFTFAFNDKVLNRVAREVHRGNLSPLAMISASIPVVMLAGMGRHFVKGDYDTWMNNKSAGQWLSYGLSQGGVFGKHQFGMDAAHDLQGGGTPFDSAMGPDLGLVKKALGAPHYVVQDDGMIGLLDDASALASIFMENKTPRAEKSARAAH